jgi:hypothetical protein
MSDQLRILLRPDEAAAALSISERTLRSLKVPSVRIGRLRLYRPEQLAEWARLREDAPEEVRNGAAKVGQRIGLQAPFGQTLGRRRPRPR